MQFSSLRFALICFPVQRNTWECFKPSSSFPSPQPYPKGREACFPEPRRYGALRSVVSQRAGTRDLRSGIRRTLNSVPVGEFPLMPLMGVSPPLDGKQIVFLSPL